ncbi:dimethylsulfonioproprionate lyase family protein [uncultured Roseibium sp.]|uniref:dimethylsulfonioproprionate lyase family protein n=1 Tax=uncultured Roseibium sp. TaxID=1936171 RepID=UPI002607722D|nr:dimethylsulfonioproprionate lyase family protein [uncultured Roseibium sp.]
MTLSDNKRQAVDKLLIEIASVFDAEGRPGGNVAAARLRDAANRPFSTAEAQEYPRGLLQRACALDTAVDWAGLVLETAPCLHWENWQGSGLSDNVSSSLYTTELLGPDGHIRDDEVRVGLLVSEAHTDYPLSRHSGEETYFAIAGEAEWVLGKAPYRRVPPGSMIHHPAWEMHGRRTLDEPFLGAWRWSGDLDLKSFEIAPA